MCNWEIKLKDENNINNIYKYYFFLSKLYTIFFNKSVKFDINNIQFNYFNSIKYSNNYVYKS